MIKAPFRLGNCEVNPIENTITCAAGNRQSIQQKSIEVIWFLARHYPRVISREELIDHIWGEHSVVGDNSLTNAIWHLRKILKRAADNGEVITTIRKVGYKLTLEPQWEQLSSDTASAAPKNAHSNHISFIAMNRLKYVTLSACIIVLLVTVSYQFNKHQKPYTPVKIERITKQQGFEKFPTPSPNGRFVVYSKPKGETGISNLFLQDTQQPLSSPKQLTFSNDEKTLSTWSSDEKFLYFIRKNKNQNTCSIIRMEMSSLQESEVTQCNLFSTLNYLDISPDNKTLAFSHKNASDDTSGIYFIRLDLPNSQPTPFSCFTDCGYTDRDMAFSPDGKTIAVTRRINRYSENIFLVDLATKHSQQLTFGDQDIAGLTWHPSGRYLIYASQRSDNRYAYALDVSTKKSINLHIPHFNFPAIAKSSGKLFYQRQKEQYNISHLQLGGEVTTSPFPTIYSEYSLTNTDYSSQQNRLVYASNESGYYEIWSSDPSGENRTQLTHLKSSASAPKWSHDGKKVAFLLPSEQGSNEIYILDLQSQKTHKLASPFTNHRRPTWSYDDSAILSSIVNTDGSDLYQININDGKSKRLTHDNGRFAIMLSPTMMIYSIPNQGLWKKDIASQLPAEKILDTEYFTTRYAWTYYNGDIYFKSKRKTFNQIQKYNLDTQQVTPLIRISKHAIRSSSSLSYIPHSDQLLFTNTLYPETSINALSSFSLDD